MSAKDLLLEKLNNKVDSLEKEAEAEEAKVEEAKAKAKDEESSQKLKDETVESLDNLRKQINEANNLIEELKEGASQNWQKLEDKVSQFLS